jgi:hypothetical protein
MFVVEAERGDFEADFEDNALADDDFAEFFEVRFFVLNGLAAGARLMVPEGVEDLEAGCFVVVAVSRAWEAGLAEAASKRRVSVLDMLRNDIYCTPAGLAFSCWTAESEMAAGGSFGESG